MLEELSRRLMAEFGRGFDSRNLRYMRQFYLAFPIRHALRDNSTTPENVNAPRSKSGETPRRNALRSKSPDSSNRDSAHLDADSLRPELSWTHYRLLLGVEDPDARRWYLNEAANQHCSTHQLERISVLSESRQIFAAKYVKILPTERELTREVERERRLIDASYAGEEMR